MCNPPGEPLLDRARHRKRREEQRQAGAASGVAVEDGCVQAFLDIKRKRAHRFVLYRIGARDERASAAPDAAPLQRRPRAAR